MSIDVPGADQSAIHASNKAGFRTAHFLVAEGYTSGESHTIGQKAGAIGSLLTLRALEQMGIIDVDSVSFDDFFSTLAQLEVDSGVRATIEGIWAEEASQEQALVENGGALE